MADEQMSATFDDYVSGGTQITAEATPPDPIAQPTSQGAAATPAPEKPAQPRDESGKFVTKEGGEAKVDSVATPQATSPTEQEAAARALGWKPLEEFGGDPRKWVEARVWVENAPLVAQIKAYKQRDREKTKALEAAQIHYSRVHEAAYQKAVREIAEAKKQAIVEQDVARVEELDQAKAQWDAERAKAPVPQPSYDPAYIEWMDNNPTIVGTKNESGVYVGGDPALKAFAMAYEQTLMATNTDIDDRLDKTTQAVRAAFPDRFKNVRRAAPALVEGNGNGASSGGGTKRFGVADLTSDERTVMNRLVASGVLTQDQYVKDIQESRNGTYSLDIN